MFHRLSSILEMTGQPVREHRGWLVIAILVLLLIVRHAVIAILSHSERRR